jgi:PAS domain S-box-containing protein
MWMKVEKTHTKMNQRASEEMLGGHDHVLFEFLGAIVILLDRNGNIVRVNPFTEKYFSVENGELLGKPFVETLVAPYATTGDNQIELFEELLAQPEKTGTLDLEVMLPDGSHKPVSWAFSACLGHGGGADELTLIGTDRQALRASENDLNHGFDFMEDFLEASNTMAYALNSEHSFYYASPAVRNVIGYSPEEMSGCMPDLFLDPEEKSRISDVIGDLILRKAPHCRLLNRNRQKNGKLVWNELNQNLYYNENGEFVGIIGINRNVDDRKKTELDLAERENEFRFCLEHAQVLLTVTDGEGVIRSINHVGAAMYGKKPEEMIGHVFTEFLPDYERERVITVFKKDFQAAMSRKDSRTVGMGGIVNKIITPDGLKDILFYKTGVKVYKQGRFEGILNTAVDITEIIKAREELKRHQNQLEQLVMERTAELQGVQEEMLRRERLTALGKMADVISQEIRSPLSTISQSLFVIRERLKDRDIGVQRSIDRAGRAIRRCYSIVDEFKDLTHTDPLKKKPTDIDAWMHGLLDEFAGKKKMNVVRRLESGATVDMDSNRLKRAVMNIIENARQAVQGSDAGRIVVKSQLAFNRLEIEISDEGAGIPRQDLEKIFEPLYSTKSFGLGLGLSISRQIVAAHGGGISVESEEKIGTKVLLWFPVEESYEGTES